MSVHHEHTHNSRCFAIRSLLLVFFNHIFKHMAVKKIYRYHNMMITYVTAGFLATKGWKMDQMDGKFAPSAIYGFHYG